MPDDRARYHQKCWLTMAYLGLLPPLAVVGGGGGGGGGGLVAGGVVPAGGLVCGGGVPPPPVLPPLGPAPGVFTTGFGLFEAVPPLPVLPEFRLPTPEPREPATGVLEPPPAFGWVGVAATFRTTYTIFGGTVDVVVCGGRTESSLICWLFADATPCSWAATAPVMPIVDAIAVDEAITLLACAARRRVAMVVPTFAEGVESSHDRTDYIGNKQPALFQATSKKPRFTTI